MHPDLARCADRLLSTLASIRVEDVDRARRGKWSVAQVVEHLDLTYTRNAAALARRITKGDAARHRRTVRQAVARFIVVQVGYFPTGRKSPDGVVPQGRALADVAPMLESHLAELDARLNEAERAFGATRAVLDHPIIGPFSVNDWRRFHWVHTHHHLKQLTRG